MSRSSGRPAPCRKTAGLLLGTLAVLATAFDFVLTFLLEARVTYRVDVRGLPLGRFAEAAGAYRTALTGNLYRVFSETKWPDKGRICFIFRSGGPDPRQHIEQLFDEHVEPSLRGSLDWEVD